jgi:hypothetical protein
VSTSPRKSSLPLSTSWAAVPQVKEMKNISFTNVTLQALDKTMKL